MEAYSNLRSIFQNISPLDHRYSLSEETLYNSLVPWISEDASVKACVKAEIALVMAHLSVRGKLNAGLREELGKAGDSVSPGEVYAEEEKTRHFMRALVNVLKKKAEALPNGDIISPLVHLGATSVDILDTSLSTRIRGVTQNVILPELKKLELLLCDFTEREAETPQVGRTHGQHAVPVTLGFSIAEYVSRLGKSIIEIERLEKNLKGKLSGAVGAYNATAMIVKDPEELERLYLAELGLEPSEHSTQLVEPEYLLRLLVEFNTAFGIIANLADDLRNLQRSEIAELREGFAAEQVGSSTMPQKRNPWNSEHVKSLWKAFMPRVLTFFMDQVSEHQRDLTNSASQRFIADYIAGFCLAVSRMAGVIESLKPNHEQLIANLLGTANSIAGGIKGAVLAEPAYILLAESGAKDAHEVIRKITIEAEKKKIGFAEALAEESGVFSAIAGKMAGLGIINSGGDVVKAALEWFGNPALYRGLAAEKAHNIAAKYRKLFL